VECFYLGIGVWAVGSAVINLWFLWNVLVNLGAL
jgi:hypothetical protein